MNHRSSTARRSVFVASVITATPATILQDEHHRHTKSKSKSKPPIRARDQHVYPSDDDHQKQGQKQKYKDCRYDRNTVLIGIAMFVAYVFANVLQETFVLKTRRTTFGRRKKESTTIVPPTTNPVDGIQRNIQTESKYSKTSNNLRTNTKPPGREGINGADGSLHPGVASSSSSSLLLAQPQHLDLQSRNGTLVTLVHIGKTGGSALRDLIEYAVGYCKENYLHNPHKNNDSPPHLAEGSLFTDAHHHEKTILQKQMCALARVTNSKGIDHDSNNNDNSSYTYSNDASKNGLVHLDRNLHKTLSGRHFLVPIRNPVDRLISWFHYEKHFQTIKQTRYSRALNELIDASRCGLSTANEVFLGKKLPHDDIHRNSNNNRYNKTSPTLTGTLSEQLDANLTRTNTNASSSSSTSTSTNTSIGLPKVATPDYCYKLSRDCLSGDIPCYGHNFFNYEYYLEDILVRILQGVASTAATAATPKNMDNDNTQQHREQRQAIPRVDVIRTEKSWDDLNQTLSEWTGLPMTPDMDFFYLHRKPFGVNTHTLHNEKRISAEAARSLCETICPELVAYTKIVKYAANLSEREKTKTRAELDATCGFSVEEVCGKSFRYRNVRNAKRTKLCEPRKKVENLSGDGEIKINDKDLQLQQQFRGRRLVYLRTHDLPSC